jgi:hypothetical protein
MLKRAFHIVFFFTHSTPPHFLFTVFSVEIILAFLIFLLALFHFSATRLLYHSISICLTAGIFKAFPLTTPHLFHHFPCELCRSLDVYIEPIETLSLSPLLPACERTHKKPSTASACAAATVEFISSLLIGYLCAGREVCSRNQLN